MLNDIFLQKSAAFYRSHVSMALKKICLFFSHKSHELNSAQWDATKVCYTNYFIRRF